MSESNKTSGGVGIDVSRPEADNPSSTAPQPTPPADERGPSLIGALVGELDRRIADKGTHRMARYALGSVRTWLLAAGNRAPDADPPGSTSAEDRLAATLEFVAARIDQARDLRPLGSACSGALVRELEAVQAYLFGVCGDLPAGAAAALSVLRDDWLGIGGDRAVLHTIDEEGHHVQLEDDGTVAAGDGVNYWAALKDALTELATPRSG